MALRMRRQVAGGQHLDEIAHRSASTSNLF
jgi:hypothetical protein